MHYFVIEIKTSCDMVHSYGALRARYITKNFSLKSTSVFSKQPAIEEIERLLFWLLLLCFFEMGIEKMQVRIIVKHDCLLLTDNL